MLIADAVPPSAVPIRFGRVPPPGQPEIAETVELPLFTTGRPLDNELGNAGRIGLAGLPVVGNAGWLPRRTATGCQVLAPSDQERDCHLERDRPRVCTRLAHTRGGVNFFGGLGGFFIRGGACVTGRYRWRNGVTSRYFKRNVVTFRYAIRNGVTICRRLQTVAVALLLDRRRAAGVGGQGIRNTLVDQRRRSRQHGDLSDEVGWRPCL